MGHTESKEKTLCINLLTHMLTSRIGVTVTPSETESFIEEVCQWLPEDGTVNLKTWVEVGKQLKKHHGSEKVLPCYFSLWDSICDTLAPEAKTVELSQNLNSPSAPPRENTSSLSSAQSKSNLAMPTDREENKYHKHDHWSFPVSREESGPPIQNRLPKLERKPKPGPVAPMNSMSKFQRAIREAEANGDLEFSLCFPVTYENEFGGNRNPTLEPIPYKVLKELKLACSEYGPLAPYTQTLVETLASKWMTPYDWSQVCKSCLSGGDYLLWKTEYDDLAKKAVATSEKTRKGITLDMILGEGDFNTAEEQMKMPTEALTKVTSCAVSAWKSLPYTAGKTTTLTEVKQKVEEPYQDFLSRLMQAVKRVINNKEAADILIKQLAFENANNTCQALLRPIRRTGTINDFIKQCADVSPAFIQGVAIAAALKGETYPQYVQGIGQASNNTGNKRNMNCYSCGLSGHFSRECPNKNNNTRARWQAPRQPGNTLGNNINPPKTVCPRCQKGFHWAKECRSKYHKNGRPLNSTNSSQGGYIPSPQLGNLRRGQPQAPAIIGASTFNPFANFNQSVTSSGQPQAVQDWTSTQPPMQY